jgi:heme exporter protein B
VRFWRVALLVALRDIRSELRSREQIATLLFFSLLVLVVFNFAFDFTVIDFVTLGPGILWVVFSFAGVLSISRSFQTEREEDRLQGLLLAPVDPSAFYLGKVAANAVFMAAVEAIVVPLSILLFNFKFTPAVGLVILALALNTIGFAAVGSLFACMTTRTRRGELLLPLLLFPAAVPIALAAVKTTGHLLAGRPLARASDWLWMSAAYDLIFLAAAVLLFEHVVEE